jgi:alkylhydroperoxidase family enzyme
MELNSAWSRAHGVSDAELSALENYAASVLFSESERASLAYAETITSANTVPEEVYAAVRRHFSDDEIVELTATITWEICAAKFNRALEIEGQGICAVRGPKD